MIRVAELRVRRDELSAEIWGSMVRTWDPVYDDDARAIARFMAARLEGLMTDGGRMNPEECSVNCVVSFERVPLSSVIGRNPSRDGAPYPSLRSLLELLPERDSVPIVGTIGTAGYTVWDGHHRLRTYEAAGRIDIPSWVARFRKGSGNITVL